MACIYTGNEIPQAFAQSNQVIQRIRSGAAANLCWSRATSVC